MDQSKTKWRNYQGKSERHPNEINAGYLPGTWRSKLDYNPLLQGFVKYGVNLLFLEFLTKVFCNLLIRIPSK